MKYLVAVSGGVDSVVLLDVLSKTDHELVVAHFDHGIREDSASDERFVAGLAARYGSEYIGQRAELGPGASEATSRSVRYEFLRAAAKKHQATIVTAHHQDDLIETIAINLKRGTGWRGLAVFGARDIARPLIGKTKQELYQYALHHQLEWVEDETNHDQRYLRNQLRGRRGELDAAAAQLVELWHGQNELVHTIDDELTKYAALFLRRYFLLMIPEAVAIESIRAAVFNETSQRPTYPQTTRALLAIKTAQPGSRHDIGDGIYLTITRTGYLVNTSSTVL